MDESKAEKDSAQNDTAISELFSTSNDSLGEAAEAILDECEKLSPLSSENNLSHLTEEDPNSQISNDPPPKINGRLKNGVNWRDYQQELSENAVNGLNTIICAPTGSGKTMVAAHIILEHLKNSAKNEIKPTVAFLARTVPLVKQQYDILSKFLKPFEVSSLIGDSEFSKHLDKLLPHNHVIVMTPCILENHLRKELLPHLGVFSMLVFDECHHTRKGEPYMELMYSYLKTKKDPTFKLPQIVGLTAAIGIENAVKDSEAVEVILQLCGSLDVDCISTVKNHKEELKQRVPVPTELPPIELEERKNNEPVNEIINIMKELENFAMDHAGELKKKKLNNLLKMIPEDKKSQQYGQWAVKMRKLAKLFASSKFEYHC